MKKLLIGIALGLMLSIPVGAGAEVVSMVNKVIDGEFVVKLNGKNLDTKSIVIEGTSYLPVRDLAERLNINVKFDATNGIELTQKFDYAKEHPLAPQLRANIQEIVRLENEKMALINKINKIKTTHATMDQNTDDIQIQVSEKENQIKALYEQKKQLEDQLKAL